MVEKNFKHIEWGDKNDEFFQKLVFSILSSRYGTMKSILRRLKEISNVEIGNIL